MKTAILHGPPAFELADEPIPSIADDEVLIRVAYCGVCTSELDMWAGEGGDQVFPRMPGHEVSGVVEAIGAQVTQFKPGDRVGVWATSRGFSEYVAVKAEYCLPAADVPLDLALAEPLACAVNTVELADISLADDVVIIGAGFMGALVQKLVQLQGPRHVIVADARDDALERAKQQGATHVVNVKRELLPEIVKELTDGRGADVTFEVTGAQAPLLLLGDVTRMSGKVAIVGYHQGGRREIPLAQWNWKAFQVINAHFREVSTIMRGMRIGMRLLIAGRLSLDGLVTHRFTLPEINHAFEVAHAKPEGFVKSTVAINS
jgi:2-desacetyl-2-hydroxyethyl bacteriochlorophyllide A dehydrogenase